MVRSVKLLISATKSLDAELHIITTHIESFWDTLHASNTQFSFQHMFISLLAVEGAHVELESGRGRGGRSPGGRDGVEVGSRIGGMYM